jgi:hypothetical protein
MENIMMRLSRCSEIGKLAEENRHGNGGFLLDERQFNL